MNRRALLVALAASSACGVAFAQSSDVRQNEQNIQAAQRQQAMQRNEERRALQNQRADERRRAAQEAQHRRGQSRHGEPSWNRRDDRRYDRGQGYGDRRADDRRHSGRGAGPDHSWYRGGRLPPQYRTRQYVVDDWRGHRLSAPPRGYHWVQAGSDYVLVAIATGIIASILLNQ